MEYNSLTLYLEHKKEETQCLFNKWCEFINSRLSIDTRFLKEAFNPHEIDCERTQLNSDFIYSKKIDYAVRFIISSAYTNDNLLLSQYTILFKTEHLAACESDNDFAMSDYRYSEKIKQRIPTLAKYLFEEFGGYVFFENEYQDGNISSIIHSNDFNVEQEDDFEFAIVPKTKIGNIFKANGKEIVKKDYRILYHKRFEFINKA